MNTNKTTAYGRKILFLTSFTLLAALLIWLSPGCNKDSKQVPSSNLSASKERPKDVYTVGWVRSYPQSNTVKVWLRESLHIYSFSKLNPKASSFLELLTKAQATGTPLRVTIATDNTITAVGIATAEEINSLFFAADAVCKELIFQEQQLLRATAGCKDTLTCDEANDLFKMLQDQGCKSTAPPPNCIPFECVYDGCDARADRMRELIEAKGFCSQKIFAFGSLEVKATLNGNNCCVTWGWHVAPVVTVKCGDSVVQRVLDPSMFNTPVNPGTWGEAMKSDCDGDGVPGSVDSLPIKPPTYYQPSTGGCYKINDKNKLKPYTDCLLECYSKNCNGCNPGTVDCRDKCAPLWK
jgi:Glutaminase